MPTAKIIHKHPETTGHEAVSIKTSGNRFQTMVDWKRFPAQKKEEAMKNSALDELCDIAIEMFGKSVANARPGSPFDQARTKLGDRFYEVAIPILRDMVLRVVTDPETREIISDATPGLPVAPMLMLTILADTVTAVVKAANEEAV